MCQFNTTLPLQQQQLAVRLPGAWACRPDLIPRDPVRWRYTATRRMPSSPGGVGLARAHPLTKPQAMEPSRQTRSSYGPPYPLGRWSSAATTCYPNIYCIICIYILPQWYITRMLVRSMECCKRWHVVVCCYREHRACDSTQENAASTFAPDTRKPFLICWS